MSSEDQIPLDVKKLIQERLHSIEALEVLLVLYQQPDRWLALPELARELRVGQASVEAAVSELAAGSLVERDSAAARYRMGAVDQDRTVAGLLHTYEHLRVETLVMISRNAIGRVRNYALQTFAEAFRLGGKKNNG